MRLSTCIRRFRAAGSAALLAVLALIATGSGSPAQDRELKIGILGPFSGTAAGAAQQVLDGLMLGVDAADGKVGGLKTTVIREVDVIVGPHYSHVMNAAYRTMVDSKTIVLSAVAGPSLIAGKQCSPYFFATSFQNDEAFEVLGLYLNEKGYKRAYLMAPNYPAGKDNMTGFKRTFKGGIAGEVYTGLSQLDFAAEIAQIKSVNPDVVTIFYPSTFGINFHKQYGQSGLLKELPLYSAFSLEEIALPAIGDVAVGTYQAATWNFDSPGEVNKKFVADFTKKYNYRPTFISAYAYDAAQLLHAALLEVKGNIADKPALIAAIEKASFTSVRGKFKFNTNHFPIQDYILLEVVKTDEGKLIQVTRGTMQRDYSNVYVNDCKMPKP
jgi:branched-chain amino acid transport system substrate-binding protein